MTDETELELTKQIGQNIKVIRRDSRVSQMCLADLLGISYQQLQKYESGKNRVSAAKLYKMSIALDVPASAFFSGIDELLEHKILNITPLRLDILKALEAMDNLRIEKSIYEMVTAKVEIDNPK